MYVVYVLDREGNPLMPTKRFGHVRRLLKSGQAKAVSTKPFVVQLLYESTNFTQPLYGGTDPGRTNIGESVVNRKGEVIYEAHVTTRNKDMPKLMAKRKIHRQASRRGERLRRKRRAKAHGTLTEFPDGRKLPRYKDGVLGLKDIINTESKFANRKRPSGWLTPTARQCVQTHVSMVKQVCKILPVTDWSLEYNKFAFMILEDGTVRGFDFQNGRMKGFSSVNDYVYHLQEGLCVLCGSSIEHYHHIVPRHKGGSNTPENIVGLCRDCHTAVHKNKVLLNAIGRKKKYAGTSIINIAIPFIYDELMSMFGEDNFHVCSGRDTSDFRRIHNIEKEHSADAACIASIGGGIGLRYDSENIFEVHQYRNHDRAIIKSQCERTYKIGKQVIAKNRKPRFEQDKKVTALSEWFSRRCEDTGYRQARVELSRVLVSKSLRRYNNTKRILAGATFLFHEQRFILVGRLSNGKYFRAYGQGNKNYLSRDCTIVERKSLVYV